MPLSNVFEKLGKAIFESPFNAARLSADVPELAEIRLVALDAIKTRSHRVAGKNVFPYNRVRIHLSGIPETQAHAFRSDFLTRYFDEELRGGLGHSQYRFPDDLQIQIETTPELPGPKDAWIRVEAESVPPPRAVLDAPVLRNSVLRIVQGSSNETEIPITKVRTNIGRIVDVFKSAGPSRRNDIAFAEDTEINRSVSREHAHILRDRTTGECRIFNDRWYKAGPEVEASCGLWIVRDGLSQPVHRSTRGFSLRHGDEIHFGRAIVHFLQDS